MDRLRQAARDAFLADVMPVPHTVMVGTHIAEMIHTHIKGDIVPTSALSIRGRFHFWL